MKENFIYQKIEEALCEENTNSALSLLKKVKQRDGYYFYYLGEIKRIEGLFKESYKNYLIALKKINKEDEIYSKILLRLASLSRSNGRIEEAKRYLDILIKNGWRNKDILLEQAMYLRMKGEFKRSLYYLFKLEKIYRKEKDFQGIAYIYWACGGIFRLQGHFKKGIHFFKRGIKYAKKANDRSLLLYLKFALAGILRIYGKPHQSLKEYKSCAKLIDRNDFFSKGYYYCGIANALRQLGKLEQSIYNYKKSYYYYKKTGDFLDLGLVVWGMGNSYLKKEEIKRAKKLFLKAKKLFRLGFEPRGEILNLISLSQVYYLKGDIKKAKKLYYDAIRKAKKYKLNTYLEVFT